jgi:hypothetical protein
MRVGNVKHFAKHTVGIYESQYVLNSVPGQLLFLAALT